MTEVVTKVVRLDFSLKLLSSIKFEHFLNFQGHFARAISKTNKAVFAIGLTYLRALPSNRV